MSLQVIVNKPEIYRILLEQSPEGVYVNVFDAPDAIGPCRDSSQDDIDMAKRACQQDYAVDPSLWQNVADENWH